jgi:D-inositol-3-phosphate glycosyltransferase
MTSTAKKPKIAIVVPSIYEGGGVPAVARFIKDSILGSDEFELKIISLATAHHDESSIQLSNPASWFKGIRVKQGEWEGLAYSHVGCLFSELEFQRMKPRAALSKVLNDCDVIQVVSGTPAWALPVVELGKPVALQVATRAVVERRRKEKVEHGPVAWWHKLMTLITNKRDDEALRKVDAVLVENNWMYAYTQSIGTEHGTWVRFAPPGVDAKIFHPADQRLQSEITDRYILSVGRFDDPRKNIGLLLEAYALMRLSMEDPPRLLLAGAGDPGKDFWKRVHELDLVDHVSFDLRPTREQLVRHYQQALCFALSSDEEGFGVVLAEAMACAVPVVATRCGGPESLITDALDGFLVPMGNALVLANRLQLLAQNKALNEQLGQAARKTVETRFTQEIAGETFIDMYRKLLQNHAGKVN